MSEHQRVRGIILDLLGQIVPQGGLKYRREPLLKLLIDDAVEQILTPGELEATDLNKSNKGESNE